LDVFCGIDWAEDHHDIALVGPDGKLLARRRISDDAAGLKALLELLGEHGDGPEDPVPVAIETPRGLLTACLRATGRPVYPVNPMSVARYRERHSVAGRKSDHGDAYVLANILRTDQELHRPLPADSELAQAIAVLARAQQDAVWDRTTAHNSSAPTCASTIPGSSQPSPAPTAASCAPTPASSSPPPPPPPTPPCSPWPSSAPCSARPGAPEASTLRPPGCAASTDDIAWWHSRFGWADLLIGGIVAPLHRGEQVSFRPPRWAEHGRGGSIEVPAGCPLLIVEGVGAGCREAAHLVDVLVWVQSDLREAERRSQARVGQPGGPRTARSQTEHRTRHSDHSQVAIAIRL
jgi:hypothetical protein